MTFLDLSETPPKVSRVLCVLLKHSVPLSASLEILRAFAAIASRSSTIWCPVFSTPIAVNTGNSDGLNSYCAPFMTMPCNMFPTPCIIPSILYSKAFTASCMPCTSLSTLSPTPCIAFRASAAAIRASSTVTFSSFCSASSMSFLPANFFTNVSGKR